MVSQLSKVNSQVTLLNSIPLIQLPVRLSALEIAVLGQTCQHLCKNNPLLKRIVLDSSQTTSIEVSAVSALESTLRKIQDAGIEVVLWSVHPQVMAVLSRTQLIELLTVDLGTTAITSVNQNQSSGNKFNVFLFISSLFKRLLTN